MWEGALCVSTPAACSALGATPPLDDYPRTQPGLLVGVAVIADFNGDCGVEIGDLLAFLAAFETGHLNADYDDGSGTGLVDGAVTIDDLLAYLVRFEAGC